MALTTEAVAVITQMIMGAYTGSAFDSGHAYLGVGNGNTAFSAAQTDLVGAKSVRAAMDAGYPTRSGNSITFKSTFGTSLANFAWQEWGIFNAASGGVMLSRKVESNGTKLSSQTWVLEVTVTISAE